MGMKPRPAAPTPMTKPPSGGSNVTPRIPRFFEKSLKEYLADEEQVAVWYSNSSNRFSESADKSMAEKDRKIKALCDEIEHLREQLANRPRNREDWQFSIDEKQAEIKRLKNLITTLESKNLIHENEIMVLKDNQHDPDRIDIRLEDYEDLKWYRSKWWARLARGIDKVLTRGLRIK